MLIWTKIAVIEAIILDRFYIYIYIYIYIDIYMAKSIGFSHLFSKG